MDFVRNHSSTSEEDDSFLSANPILHDFEETPDAARPNPTDIEDQDCFSSEEKSEAEGLVPYQTIYSFSSHIVLLNGSLKVKILGYKRSASTIMANPNLYLIGVEYQNSKWILQRRYKHFQNLHNQLQLLRTALTFPFPSKTHREQRASFKAELHKGKTKQNSIPRFPLVPEALISEEHMELRISQLENYLNAVLENVVYRNHFETLRFLEISQISFIDQLGVKRKEGLMKKHNGDNSSVKYNIYCREEDGQAGCCCFIACQRFGFSGFWRRRWIFVKDSFFGYFRPATNEIRCILLMDQEFKVRAGYSETGLKYGMIVSNSCRTLVMKGLTKRETNEWIDCIQQVMETTGSDFVQLTGATRFRSFVPVRENTICSWFVDGADFMSTVADVIENAKDEIMIADWWLSPEIYMKRPIIDGNKWRLDAILHRKAEEGVRVFVLLYKEVEMALGINSRYSKKALSLLHPNIRVLRHPDHIAGTGTLLWAHHEKLVIIDQTTAFVSGIDLCFGRWDDEKHRLTDLGSASWSNPMGMQNITSSHSRGQQKPGVVFHFAKTANQVTLGTVTSNATRPDGVSKEDHTSQMEPLEGRKGTIMKPRKHKAVNFLEIKSRNSNLLRSNGPNEEFHKRVSYKKNDQLEESAKKQKDCAIDTHQECEGSTKLWIGKDYTNFIVKDSDQLDKPLIDSVDRTTTPRMPWHDIGCVVTGKAARDVARHFIQRWNATKVEKAKDDINFPFLVPKSYVNSDPCIKRNNLSTFANCQVLRSSSTWSVGSRITEDSIHSAYIHAIENSEHFIYIENQFFITLACDSGVSNRIGEALYDRIVLASERQSRFRVIVVLPLLPGFEGQIGTKSGIAMHAIMHWNYASISRGKNSLLERLRLANIDPMTYISFYGLRTHSQLNQQLVTELIYVHSKLMIVDDKLVICGSANINDRSLLGKRDSELAIIFEDSSFIESLMDGKPYFAGKFALSLRKRLFREHLGLLNMEFESEQDIMDPITDSFYKDTWIRIAALNTKIYEEVFRCIPCDEVTSFEKLQEFQSVLPLSFTDPIVAHQKLKRIQGHLVLLPLNFMSEEDLTPASGTPEALMPMSLWT